MKTRGGKRVKLSSGTARDRGAALTLVRPALGLAAALLLLLVNASAQSSHDAGTPAESRGGTAASSTYAPDKLETVNLANGNLSISLPLVTVGGRGSATFAVTLSYNSKVWSSSNTVEPAVKDMSSGQIIQPAITHYYAKYDDHPTWEPNRLEIGGGWFINLGPAFKVKRVDIDRINPAQCPSVQSDDGAPCGYKYVLTKAWLVLPDGSEVELRDNLTEGAPALTPAGPWGTHTRVDRDRGRVWHSTDGSFVTVVLDEGQAMSEPGFASGWVYLADGTRLRMENGTCAKIIDRNGNVLLMKDPTTGASVYTDQLGRQVYVSEVAGVVNVVAKGYGGAPDRVITVNTGKIGDAVGGVLENLRADFRSLPRPFTAGDHWKTYSQGDFEHTITTPHTDLFSQSESEQYVGGRVEEATVVTGIQLLDGRSIRFRYNQYGEVAEVIYPGGGVSRIDYEGGQSSLCGGFAPFNNVLDRRVAKRRLLTDGVNVDATWFYTGSSSSTVATIKAHKGDGETGPLLLSEKHFFKASTSAQYMLCTPTRMNGTGYAKWENSREYRVERQTGTGTQVTVKEWEQRAPVVWAPDIGLSYNAYAAEHGQEQPQNDPRVVWKETTLENGKKSRVEYTYGSFNNAILVKEYDLRGASEEPGTPLRQTVRTYVGGDPAPSYNGYCYTNLNPLDAACGTGIASDPATIIHQRHLLLSEEVKDSAGVREGYTEYEYDAYRDVSWAAAPPEFNPGMIGYDGGRFAAPGVDQTRQPRGNVTSVKAWIEGAGAGASYAVSFNRYDTAGNFISSKDPGLHVTSFSYADDFGDGTNPGGVAAGPNGATYAFPTKAINPLGQQAKIQYDYTRSVPTGVKDANGVVTKTEYDPQGRPVRTTAALGLPEQAVSEMSYQIALENVVRVSKQLDATRWQASKTEFDGFDRPVLTSSSEDGQHASVASYTVFRKTVYDALGRVRLATNPYRAQPSETDGWTRTVYDLAGRVTEVASFAGGASSPPPDTGTNTDWTGSIITTYSGLLTTVRDQANKQRRTTADGLGRLKSVEEMYEFPSASVYATTSYDYDARGNLKAVHQGQQTRAFTYDGLSRLKSATHPESCLQQGVECIPVPATYTYDPAGNLNQKTDARGVTTTYEYDEIKRVTRRTYSDSTPAVAYFYDAQPLPPGAPAFDRGHSTGKLVAVTYGGGLLGSYTGEFDALGRPRLSRQVTDTGSEGVKTYSMAYEYDAAGNLKSETYPSERVVTTEYDPAGRIAGVKNQATGFYYAGSTGTDSLNRIQYATSGAASAVKLGNGLWESTLFNSRLQPVRIGLGSSSVDTSVLELNYTYGVAAGGTVDPTKNNGNLLSQAITVPGAPVTLVQNYAYDEVNRLTTAEEKRNSSSNWKQVYAYDPYGNRTLAASTTHPAQLDATNNPQVSAATNRIVSPGYGYDAAGNLLCDPLHPCAQAPFAPYYAYDAENKIRSAGGGIDGGGTSYTYDGDGRRVRKATYNGEVTVFVYDAAGKTVAEYSNQVEYNGTRYPTADTLGSTRVVTDKDGGVKSRHDYVPFGEELPGDADVRTAARGYTGEGIRRMFTGYERDEESGLDYAENRYYSSTAGRYTSLDPMPIQPRHLSDPQNLNRYVYVTNNPLKYVDPNALEKIIVIIRTWIPTEKVTAGGGTYNGNVDRDGNRKAGAEGYKTEQWIEFDTNSSGDTDVWHNFVGMTHQYDGNGNITKTAHAGGETLNITAERNGDGSVTVIANGNEVNPLAGVLAPGITLNFKVNVHSNGTAGDARVSVSGQHDGYPAYEILVLRPESGNTSTLVYSHNPNDTGEGPISLFGSGEYYPKNVQTTIPSRLPPPTSSQPPAQTQPSRQRRKERKRRPRRQNNDD